MVGLGGYSLQFLCRVIRCHYFICMADYLGCTILGSSLKF
jgi:hypothetical protein